MSNQIRQAKVNWVIPAKGVFSEGIEDREILVTKNYVFNKQTGNKTFFKQEDNSTDKTASNAEVQFGDFQITFDKNIKELTEEHGTVFLSRFRTNSLNINLYANRNSSGDIIPYVTVTTRSNRDMYYLLVSNNNPKSNVIFDRNGWFVGYLGYDIQGCKLITVGHLKDSAIPLYIKSGDVIFTNERGYGVEKSSYTVRNLMLYNKDKSEKVMYKRLFTCDTLDMKIDVKYMKVMVPNDIVFELFGKFVDENGSLMVDALKDLKNFDSEEIYDGSEVDSNFVYQFNLLYVDKETGQNKGIGFTYFPVTV